MTTERSWQRHGARRPDGTMPPRICRLWAAGEMMMVTMMRRLLLMSLQHYHRYY